MRLVARVARWQLPAARSREVVLGTQSGLMVAGGLSAAKVSTSSVWLLAPGSGRAKQLAPLAEAVHDATGVVVSGKPLVIAGGNTTTVDVVQQLTATAAHVVGHLPQPRSDLVSTTAGASAYVLGGFDGTTALSPVLRTTDGRRFTTVAHLPVTVRYPAVVALGNRLLLFGGEHNDIPVDDVQQVDLTTGRARIVGHLPLPLAHEAAFVLDGTAWLVGGRSGGQLQTRIWRWDPTRGRALPGGRLPYAVADAGLAVAGSTAYLVGGETPDPTARVITLSRSGGQGSAGQ